MQLQVTFKLIFINDKILKQQCRENRVLLDLLLSVRPQNPNCYTFGVLEQDKDCMQVNFYSEQGYVL